MRLQLALNVVDLDAAIAFYSAMFATEPAKVRPGYANFAIEQPPLKLVLFETPTESEDGTINHLGVEVDHADEVSLADTRLAAAGLSTTGVENTECCFAAKTETWVEAPDGNRWEFYVKTGDVEHIDNIIVTAARDDAAATGSSAGNLCCAPTANVASPSRS